MTITQTRTKVEEAVANGVAYLDEHHPGWANRIDLDTFHLESCTRCVAGQLGIWHTEILGSFPHGLRRARRFGMYGGDGLEDQATYRELTREWVRVIREKQA